jgi:hypothetical protein
MPGTVCVQATDRHGSGLRLGFLVTAGLLAHGSGLGWPPSKQRRGCCGTSGCRVGLAQDLLVVGKGRSYSGMASAATRSYTTTPA